MSGSGRDQYSQVAESVPFDNDTNGFTSDEVQAAIEEVNDKIIDQASPGYTWGKSGNVSNAWLLNDTVPSDKCGRNFSLHNGVLTQIAVANEGPHTFDVELYEHDGATYTLLATVSIAAARSGEFDSSDFGTVNVTKGKELAVKIATGSAKNPIVAILLSGTISP